VLCIPLFLDDNIVVSSSEGLLFLQRQCGNRVGRARAWAVVVVEQRGGLLETTGKDNLPPCLAPSDGDWGRQPTVDVALQGHAGEALATSHALRGAYVMRRRRGDSRRLVDGG
jgi:hypothetical protein